MALPELEITLHWVGLRVVDPAGQAVGTVEAVFADAATEQAEWALVQTDDGNGSKFVPLLDARQDGNDVRVAFDRTAVTGAPVITAPDELTEDEEAQLYTHYGLEFDTAGSVLPTPEATPPDISVPSPETAEAPSEPAAAPAAEPEPEARPKRGRKKKDAPTEAMPVVPSSVAAPLEVPAIVPPVDAAPAAALAADVPPPAAEPEPVVEDEPPAPEPVASAPEPLAPPVVETGPTPERPTPIPAWEPVPPAPVKVGVPVIAGGALLVLLWLWRRRR